ncbi:MAG: GMC family oxidoreductase N-terminal domain-containing protein [Ectothiorhodospiraceae bacterium]|nr:GMC family oxidoreductase N-terminal domain-containing protein [Ectothiorhodospiraceae bacterium]
MSDNEFDYIIVGAGSAGAALANRLSARPDKRVLLLEAGRESHPWSRIPVGFARLIDNPAANWLYSAEPEEATRGRRVPVPRGRLLGGSSSINGMVFVRGQRQDYDTWAQLGNRGWSYEDVLPIFKEMESYQGGDAALRGRDGVLKVTDNKESGPLYDALFAAAEQVGIPRNPDYNGASQEGISITQATISNGRRMSTAQCYLEPARGRANLRIETHALANGLIIEGKRCVGVRYARAGVPQEARARAEVVVSAGSINSPQLLELSGIGRPELLREHGIEVVQALPGVGENLREHYSPRLRWAITHPGLTYNDTARGVRMVGQVLRYVFGRSGLLAMSAGPIRAFFRTRPGLEAPDAGTAFFPFLVADGFRLARESGITGIATQLRPESRGSIHIQSPDPRRHPAIRYNFLTSPIDRETLIAATRKTRELMDAPAMAGLRGAELAPGPEVSTDDEILDWIKETAETTYHPVGTCKMGADPMAVVDDQLRVHGIERLRVADASIMPTLTSGNTNAPSIMIGEKAARMILAS